VQALQRPFLVDKGYSDFDRGFMLFWIGLVANIVGTFAGGLLTRPLGLGRSLWIFGFLQIFSNVGYALVAHQEGINRPLMYGAFFFEAFASGLGGGAFLVLMLRITQKRFSATQYALFSSLFGLPRIISGPVVGFMVYALGWETFFWDDALLRHSGHADARPLRALGRAGARVHRRGAGGRPAARARGAGGARSRRCRRGGGCRGADRRDDGCA
jgi:hypothetical protein